MWFTIGLIIGLIVGGAGGVIITAIMMINSDRGD